MPRTTIQSLLLVAAGLLWVTLPDGTPPLEWRLHFGGVMWCFGAMTGIAISLTITRSSEQKADG